jgi:hypothetical protein
MGGVYKHSSFFTIYLGGKKDGKRKTIHQGYRNG